ncbi:TetR/AcrR family transcriptional regulator [Gryllotalpicola ginsengisoli]|uniref:TetR/AcrR family transcriptional regulator n=1 Tax=Gryllotalpicola ginsengisoli TaxID=444608 RepID=UPI0003B50F1E|nr:TetR/AcrR family transcriptional regulator [Gryllotalpicola ginsengisoli]
MAETRGNTASRGTAASKGSASKPRAPRKDAEANREAILDAAAVLLMQDRNTPLEAIARQAGLTRRAIYGHFDTRDDLIDAVLLHAAAELTAALDPISHPDPRVELALHASRLWADSEDVRLLTRLAGHGRHRDQVARMLEPVRIRLRQTVERGAASGAIRDDIDPSSLARLIESTALSVLAESRRTFLAPARGHDLVIECVLGIAGMGWREVRELIERTAVLAYGAELDSPALEPAWLRA